MIELDRALAVRRGPQGGFTRSIRISLFVVSAGFMTAAPAFATPPAAQAPQEENDTSQPAQPENATGAEGGISWSACRGAAPSLATWAGFAPCSADTA